VTHSLYQIQKIPSTRGILVIDDQMVIEKPFERIATPYAYTAFGGSESDFIKTLLSRSVHNQPHLEFL